MASKKMKRLGKAAALLASRLMQPAKMGSDNKSGITDTADQGSENKNVSALISGASANTTGSIKSASPTKYGFKKRSIMEDIKGLGKKIGKAFQGPVANV
jgi:hypothetical protein